MILEVPFLLFIGTLNWLETSNTVITMVCREERYLLFCKRSSSIYVSKKDPSSIEKLYSTLDNDIDIP